MTEIKLLLSPYLLGHLRDLLVATSRSVDGKTVIPSRLPEDDDGTFDEAWKSGLIESLRADITVLIDVFNRLEPGKTSLQIDEEHSEAVLRAASALRLRLCEVFLQELKSDILEDGSVDFHELSLEQQHAYAAYLILAELQEQLIHSLDPESSNYWME